MAASYTHDALELPARFAAVAADTDSQVHGRGVDRDGAVHDAARQEQRVAGSSTTDSQARSSRSASSYVVHDAERFARQWRHSLAPLSWSTRICVESIGKEMRTLFDKKLSRR